MKHSSKIHSPTAFACVIALGACAHTGAGDDSFVSKMWSKQVSQFTIFPVFPPRADIQVGDMYMVCYSTEQTEKPTQKTLWLASLTNITDTPAHDDEPARQGLLSKHYLSRVRLPDMPIPDDAVANREPEAPASPSDAASAAGAGLAQLKVPAVQKPVAAHQAPANTSVQESSFAGNQFKRMKPVSLPEFFSVSVTKAQASALVPFPTILAKAGLSYENAQNISVSVPQAESYGLPDAELLVQYYKDSEHGVAAIAEAENVYRRLSGSFCAADEQPAMMIVGEVYATRAIDISITYSREVGAEAAAGLSIAPGSSQANVLSSLLKLLNIDTGKSHSELSFYQQSQSAVRPQIAVKPINPGRVLKRSGDPGSAIRAKN